MRELSTNLSNTLKHMNIGLTQQQAHWLHTEVPMMSDLNDWNSNLTETEKNIIGSILKRICSNRNYCK
jgi:ribonucleotide reductase beta subunit family protein with ferritin-like domain